MTWTIGYETIRITVSKISTVVVVRQLTVAEEHAILRCKTYSAGRSSACDPA